MKNSWEKEFFQLAGFMLYCRARVMGLEIEDDPYAYSLEGSVLGEMDYSREMKLMVKEL